MVDSLNIGTDYRTVQQIVTDNLRNAILNGTLRPSERLNQADLAQKLNVSRIPTREALRTLEAEGLVTSYPRRGAVVSTMSSEEIEEVFEIRILLEMSAAQRALPRIDAKQLQLIRSLQLEMERVSDAGLWIKLNKEFHHAIYEPSGWTRLLSVIDMMRNLVAPYLRLYISDSEEIKTAISEHATIVAAIEAKDTTALTSSLTKHLNSSRDGILARLRAASVDRAQRRPTPQNRKGVRTLDERVQTVE